MPERSKRQHRLLFLTCLVVCGICLPCCHSAIVLTETGLHGFEISVSGVKIFSHSPESPMMFIGTGHTKYAEKQGHFSVKNDVTSRIPLTELHTHASPLSEFDIELQGEDATNHIRFVIREAAGHSLVLEVTDYSNTFDRVWLRLVAEPSEEVYGAGEQFSFLNLRERTFPVWTTEKGVGHNKTSLTMFYADVSSGSGGDYHTTSFPQPTFLSTRNYYFHYGGSGFAEMDFTHETFHELHVLGVPAPLYVQVAQQSEPEGAMTSLVKRLTNFLGRQPLLPAWLSTGAVLATRGGISAMRSRLQQAEESGMAVAGLWMQDWAGCPVASSDTSLLCDWTWSRELYPDLPQEIDRLSRRRIRVLAYISPYLLQSGRLFDIAEQNGFLVKNTSGQAYISDFGDFYGGFVDLTNPSAFNWYKNDVLKKNVIDLGFGGWMADGGEHLPVSGVVLHSGQPASYLHNLWPVLWARLNREAVEESGKLGEVVFWMRAGYSGTGNYSTLMWAGEQRVDWSLSDGVASPVPAALSLGLSGVGLTHFDVGGHTSFPSLSPPLVRTEECLLRSAETAVFTPVFRTREGNHPSDNVQYYSSRGTLAKFARLTRMFATLQNYTHHVTSITSRSGLPAQRPMFLSYPSDNRTHDLPYQYMYGPDLLVAPVYLPGVESWDVYLPFDPEAAWVFLWDQSRRNAGGVAVRVPSPVGKPPVFYRNTSAFAEVFRRVGAEPLADIPTYVPQARADQKMQDAAPQDFVPVCKNSSPLFQLHSFAVLSLLIFSCLHA